MRIVVVSQYYPPENVPIPAEVARGLAERGHSVRVITGYPNYPKGNIFAGYRQRWRGRELDGPVQVLRVPLFADHSPRALRRMLNYLSFALSSASARGFANGADVVYVYATQMTAALGPWLWRLVGGPPYVLHVQDLWPDSITGSSLVETKARPGLIEKLITPWLSSVYRHAAAVIAIAPTMLKTLVERGVAPEKAQLVYNWADEPAAPAPAHLRTADGTTRILYAGNVGDMQDLETAVIAAHNASGCGVHLTVLGDGVALPRIKQLAKDLGCTNVEFRGQVPMDQVHRELRGADFALVCLKDLPVFRGTIPSKFQTALANGVPVVSTVQGDLRELVDSYRIGFSADAEDPDALAATFCAASRLDRTERIELGVRAHDLHQTLFAASVGMAGLERVLRSSRSHRSARDQPA